MMLYAITILSFIAFIYILFGSVSKMSNVSNKNLMGLTGNAVLNPGENQKIGDKLGGGIILSSNQLDNYGVLLLTKDNKPVLTETFNLNNFPKEMVSPNQYSVKIENLLNYTFEEKGSYGLMFYVLDLDINIKKNIVVE